MCLGFRWREQRGPTHITSGGLDGETWSSNAIRSGCDSVAKCVSNAQGPTTWMGEYAMATHNATNRTSSGGKWITLMFAFISDRSQQHARRLPCSPGLRPQLRFVRAIIGRSPYSRKFCPLLFITDSSGALVSPAPQRGARNHSAIQNHAGGNIRCLCSQALRSRT